MDIKNLHGEVIHTVECNMLTYADLRGSDLIYADLREADLREANLSGANLDKANLDKANLCGANLNYSNLSCSELCYTNLQGANLSGANITGANLLLSKGLVYSQCSFSSFGERGRMLTGAIIGDEVLFWSGCLSGYTEEKLREYINQDSQNKYKESHELALDFVIKSINTKKVV